MALTDKQVQELAAAYALTKSNLSTLYKELDSKRVNFPKHYDGELNFADLVVQAADLKHASIDFMHQAVDAYESIEADLEYVEADFKINKADNFLKDRGFDKITDEMRKLAVRSQETINLLALNRAKLRAMADAGKLLVKAWETTETNHRIFFQNHENKFKRGGL